MKSSIVALLGLAALSGMSQAAVVVLIDATTRNGSFDSPTLAASIKSGFDAPASDIVNWTNTNISWAGTAGTYGDTGVDLNAGGAHTGNQFAFFKGSAGGAFNLTNYAIQSGDQFSLSWYGRADTIGVRLFSSTDASYATAVTLAQISQAQPGGYAQYSLSYTAVPADAGKTIGVSVFNSAIGYANVDDFVLTVTQVPEPSSCLSLAVGGAALVLRRSRRTRLS